MEPKLDDISDYKKPLEKSKKKTILKVFGIMIGVFIAYQLIIIFFSQ